MGYLIRLRLALMTLNARSFASNKYEKLLRWISYRPAKIHDCHPPFRLSRHGIKISSSVHILMG